jgi:hypothetical protein
MNRRPNCTASQRGITSFEVIRTFEHARTARLNVYLGPLLEVAAGSNKLALHERFLKLQRNEALKYLTSKHLDKAARREDARSLLEGSHQRLDDCVSVQDLVQAFGNGKPLLDPLSEPYLQLTLGKLQADRLAKLKAAEVPLPDSYNMVILPDFTRSTLWRAGPKCCMHPRAICTRGHLCMPPADNILTLISKRCLAAGLPEGCIAAYIDGKELSRPAGLPHDAPWEVLLTGAPGMRGCVGIEPLRRRDVPALHFQSSLLTSKGRYSHGQTPATFKRLVFFTRSRYAT